MLAPVHQFVRTGQRDLNRDLELLEERAAQLRRHIAAAECRETGCKMEHIGGRNACCGDGCQCSIPVYVCRKCGDSDYGDNAEAAEIIRKCKANA